MLDVKEVFKTMDTAPPKKGPKIDYEFQDLALQIIERTKPKYPSAVWALFHDKNYPVPLIRDTWFEFQKNSKVSTFPYFVGCLRNKVGIKKKT